MYKTIYTNEQQSENETIHILFKFIAEIICHQESLHSDWNFLKLWGFKYAFHSNHEFLIWKIIIETELKEISELSVGLLITFSRREFYSMTTVGSHWLLTPLKALNINPSIINTGKNLKSLTLSLKFIFEKL